MEIESPKSKVEVAIRRIDRLMDGSWLKLAAKEIELIISHRGHRSINGVNFKYDQVEITPSRAIK